MRIARQNADSLREAFIDKLIAKTATRTDYKQKDKDKAIKAYKRLQTESQQYKRIDRVLKDNDHTPLTRIEIGDRITTINPVTGEASVSEEEIITIYSQEALENAIIDRNKKHFSQAKGTPFTLKPLSDITNHNFNLTPDGIDITDQLPPRYLPRDQRSHPTLTATTTPKQNMEL